MQTLAMHISNGIIDGPVAAVFAAIALAAMTVCVLRGRQDLDDRLAPMAGLVAAFIFAVQMLNFPIFTAGVSGHLLGGALAAPVVAVGPGLHVQVIIDAFVVVVIGGMGSVLGALVASLLVGIVNAFGVLAFPGIAVVLTFAVMAVVLIVRPWGLFGAPE